MTDCTIKNPCVEKYYSSMTKEERLAEIETSLKYARGIVRNLKKERGKIIKNIS